MIDSHTHLFLCERPEADVVAAALEAGVERMLNVGLEQESNAQAIAAAERHESVFATAPRPRGCSAPFTQTSAGCVSVWCR